MSSKILGKPMANSDVLNAQPKTLLIGYGWVGQHLASYFTNAYWTDERDELRRVKDNTLARMPGDGFDLAFIQVPTPMNEETGECNLDAIFDVVSKWDTKVKLFIIRSTVTPGTTDYLNKISKKYYVFQPEYLGETLGHPLLEPKRDPFIILGGPKNATQMAAQYWASVLHPNARIRQMSAKGAEWCKYMENSFLGEKVKFVSDWRRAMEKDGVDFLEVREAWLDDERIGRSHTMAYKDNPGFSGKCLPKDMNAIVHYARNVVGQPLEGTEATLRINANMRAGIKNTVPLLPKKKQVWFK